MDIIGQGSLLGLKWNANQTQQKPALKKAQTAPKPGMSSALTEEVDYKQVVRQAEKEVSIALADQVWNDLLDDFNQMLDALEEQSTKNQNTETAADVMFNQAPVEETLSLTQFAQLLKLSRNRAA